MVILFLIYSMIDRVIDLMFDRIISAFTPLPAEFNVGDHFVTIHIRFPYCGDEYHRAELCNATITKKDGDRIDVTYTRCVSLNYGGTRWVELDDGLAHTANLSITSITQVL